MKWLCGALIAFLSSLPPSSKAALFYKVTKVINLTDLNASADGAIPMSVTGLNASGRLVGYFPSSNNNKLHAFVWDDSTQTLTDLNAVLGADSSMATCVNDAGVVAGIFWTSDGNYTQTGFVYQGNALYTFAAPDGGGGAIVSVTAINALNSVIGTYIASDYTTRGFIVQQQQNGTGNISDLGDLDIENYTSYFWPASVNGVDQVVGSVYYEPLIERHVPFNQGFFWSSGTITPIDASSLAADWNAVALNDLGQAVGQYGSIGRDDLFGIAGSFFAAQAAVTDLGNLGGGAADVSGILSDGTAVGTALGPDGLMHLFDWNAANAPAMSDLGIVSLFDGDISFRPISFSVPANSQAGSGQPLFDIAGFGTDASGNTLSLLWRGGTINNVLDLLPTYFSFTTVSDMYASEVLVNSAEQIACAGTDSEGHQIALLLSVDPDTDNNGLPDSWEMQYYGHLGVDPNASEADEGGLTNLDAFEQGVDPTGYNTKVLSLAIVSGSNQTGAPNSVAPLPLVVSVSDSYGTPLANAPVTFMISDGTGELQQSSGTLPGAVITVLTDGFGQASVLFDQPNALSSSTSITVSDVTGRFSIDSPFLEQSSDSGTVTRTTPGASGISVTANPTGDSGAFNGEVTTGGSYDPFTGNATRSITDLSVNGANGSYPLAFTRVFNSRDTALISDYPCFGDGVSWRHSYQWAIGGTTVNSAGNVTGYTVDYPTGGQINFVPAGPGTPVGEYASYWRGPIATQDRLEIVDNAHANLHLSDGGIVKFLVTVAAVPAGTLHVAANYTGNASSIIDPNGAVTLLSYSSPSHVSKVTEPGGRTLSLYYGPNVNTPGGSLLDHVTDSTGRTVTYSTVQYGTSPGQWVKFASYVLTGVIYNSEPISGGGYVQAGYTYGLDVLGGNAPLLTTCFDPHYSGAMVGIRYSYSAAPGVIGLIREEENINTGERVSNLTRNTSTNTSTELRGDGPSGNGPSRDFRYGEAGTGAQSYQLTSFTDFYGIATHLTFRPAGDPNGHGNLQSITDTLSHVTNYQTEPITGKVTAVIRPDNSKVSQTWIGLNGTTSQQPYYLAQTTDERGNSVVYHRISNTGLVFQIDYPDNTHEYFAYRGFVLNNAAFYKVSVYTDQRGAQTIYGYDENDVNHGGSGHIGLLTSVTQKYADGVVNGGAPRTERTALYYDGYDRMVKYVDQRGVTDTFTYTGRDQITAVTHTDATSRNYYYDNQGNCTEVGHEVVNGKTCPTFFTYDEYRRLISATTPVNDGINPPRFANFIYECRDNSGNLLADALSHTAANWDICWTNSGKATQRVYNSDNWLSDEHDGMVVPPNGSGPPVPGVAAMTTHIAYFANGQVGWVTDPEGQIWSRTYDIRNRLRTATDPLGHQTTWTYYPNNTFDSSGRNAGGLLHQVTAPGPDLDVYPTATTQYASYDAMGRVLSVIDPFSHTYASNYDAGGDLAGQTDGAHNTAYQYDQIGRLDAIIYPDTSDEVWKYDASGNEIIYKNRSNNVCTTQYDLRNTPLRKDWSDGVTSPTAWAIDPSGRLTDVGNWASAIHFDYDDTGLLKDEKLTVLNLPQCTTNYVHDTDGNIKEVQYPNGNLPFFAYDEQQRPTAMYSGAVNFGQYNYSGNHLVGRALLNTLYTEYDYQSNGRCWDVWHYHGDINGNHTLNGSVSRHVYGFAPDGQISWFDREADRGQSGSSLEDQRGDAFYYWPDRSVRQAFRDVVATGGWPGIYNTTNDARVEPSNISYAGGTVNTYANTYNYDLAGNRQSVTQLNPAQNIDYTVDGENRYNYSAYNSNGDTTNSAVGWTYTYDDEGHMMSGSNPGTGEFINCWYDGLGRLVYRNLNNVTSAFYYAGAQRIEEHEATGGGLRYLYFYDSPNNDNLLFRQDNTWGRLWYQRDLMGNTTHLSNDAGQVVEQYLYDAYGTPSVFDAAGNPRAGNASVYDNHALWKSASGYEWLASPALYHCRARFYLPEHGRFLQPDPIGQAGGLNIYTYCGNDPVNGADSSGLADPYPSTQPSQAESGLPAGVQPGVEYGYGPGNIFTGSFDSSGNWNGNGGSAGNSVNVTAPADGTSFTQVGTNPGFATDTGNTTQGAANQGSGGSGGHGLGVGILVKGSILGAVGQDFAPGTQLGNAISSQIAVDVAVANTVSQLIVPGEGEAVELVSTAKSLVEDAAEGVVPELGALNRLPMGPGAANADEFLPRVLQSGGRTISSGTARELGMERSAVGRALEALKRGEGIPNDFHGNILSNGDYVDPDTGEVLGNLLDYSD
jgi:RHS repeat-associated protein